MYPSLPVENPELLDQMHIKGKVTGQVLAVHDFMQTSDHCVQPVELKCKSGCAAFGAKWATPPPGFCDMPECPLLLAGLVAGCVSCATSGAGPLTGQAFPQRVCLLRPL